MSKSKVDPRSDMTLEGNKLKINFDDIFIVTVKGCNEMKKCMQRSKEKPETIYVRYIGPDRDGLTLCNLCGKYHSSRVKKCNNPACRNVILTEEEFYNEIKKEIEVDNGHQVFFNSIRVK